MNENTFQLGWFERSEVDGVETLLPLPLARSLWSEDQMHGVAVSGLLARTLEATVAREERTGLVPARYRVDLFRPARMVATTSRAQIVRSGPRLVLVDAVVEQDGVEVARAGATFLAPSSDPEGSVWSPGAEPPTPPGPELAPTDGRHHVPLFASERGWSDDFTEHQNAGRHQTWQTAMPIVADEECTPFQAVASIADATSMVTNWGSRGVEYINTDIDLALVRPPVGVALGLRAADRLAADGLAVGTAEVFDRQGVLGTATVTSLVNARRTVDFSGSEWDGTKQHPGA